MRDSSASLEFENDDLPLVRQAISARFGQLEIEPHLLYQDWRFGGCDFLFQAEWDDPCLIGSTPDAAALLRALCADLNRGVVRLQQPYVRDG